MIKRVLILNGPPQSGKDHLAKVIESSDMFSDGVEVASFKEPLLDMASAILGLSRYEIAADYENLKKTEVIGGMTLRQLMIDISENYLKPKFGQDIMGRIEANRVKTYVSPMMRQRALSTKKYPLALSGRTLVYPDGGFGQEVTALFEVVAPENIYIIRIHRDGHSFAEDSRSYLSPETTPALKTCNFFDIVNKGDPRMYAETFIDNVFFAIRNLEKRQEIENVS